MSEFLVLPDTNHFILQNATVPGCLVADVPEETHAMKDGLISIDIEIKDKKIASIAKANSTIGIKPGVDIDGSMVWPCFIDVHTHIDKGHIWPRKRNPDGTRPSALAATGEDRNINWSPSDIQARMEFSLATAYAHGTAAIRTHIDSTAPQHLITWPVVKKIRDSWKERIAIQAVCLEPLSGYADSGFGKELAGMMVEYGGILGAVLNIQNDTERLLDFIIGLAIERQLDLDFHVDEMGDPEARSFDEICKALIRNEFPRRVNVGHCCSLAVRPFEEVSKAIDLGIAANLSVTSLPMCNLFLQGRTFGTTPRWRGVTLLHELRSKGILVAIASDNTRDPFHAYGDLDGLEVFTQAVRIAQLDYPIDCWPMAITSNPAEIMGLSDLGRLKTGSLADLVIFRGRDYSEILSRPQQDRLVLRKGKPINTLPPDYRVLDNIVRK